MKKKTSPKRTDSDVKVLVRLDSAGSVLEVDPRDIAHREGPARTPPMLTPAQVVRVVETINRVVSDELDVMFGFPGQPWSSDLPDWVNEANEIAARKARSSVERALMIAAAGRFAWATGCTWGDFMTEAVRAFRGTLLPVEGVS